MYNVSNEYKTALKDLQHTTVIRGAVDNEPIDDSNILKSSLSIVKQCSEGSEVKIGSVYVSTLKVVLKDVPVIRNTWKGRTITFEEGLRYIRNGAEVTEYVPMGEFFVDDAEHTSSGTQITAYDGMFKFDRTFPANTIQGTAWSILGVVCTDCGVTTGMTQAQVQALPNGNLPLSMYTENDVETYRDVLSWLAQTLSCFAYMGRDGKLYLKKYHSTVDDTMTTAQRFKGFKCSDFITRYTGLSVVDIETQKTNYYSVTPDDGLTYNLGSNPFLQLGTESTKKNMRETVLQGLQEVQYTPFEAEWSTGAAYDLGDVLEFPGGLGEGDKGCVMHIEWKYHVKTKFKGFGSDPSLASARSKTDKDISGLMSKTDENGIQYYTYMNAEDIDIADGNVWPVVALRFTTMQTEKVTFQAEILVDVDTQDEAEITATYQLDGAEIRFKPTETWRDGKHILNLWYVIEVEPNTLFRWVVYLEVNGGSAHIDAENARAAVWGQGLVSVKTWNGYIDVEDTIGLIDITRRINFINFTDDLEVWTDVPYAPEGEETIGLIDITRRIDFIDFEDYVLVDKESLFFGGYTWGDVNEEIWATVHDDYTW
jgi:hypothetical protein